MYFHNVFFGSVEAATKEISSIYENASIHTSSICVFKAHYGSCVKVYIKTTTGRSSLGCIVLCPLDNWPYLGRTRRPPLIYHLLFALIIATDQIHSKPDAARREWNQLKTLIYPIMSQHILDPVPISFVHNAVNPLR